MNDGRALPEFICQAFDSRPITVHGDGLQTRSFCFVSDLVEGLFRAALSSEEGPINLGNPDEVTIGEFAREVVALTNSESEITFTPRPVDDPTVRKPDITRARTLLGWEPRVKRADGLARTIEYFRHEVESANAAAAPRAPMANDRAAVSHADQRVNGIPAPQPVSIRQI